MRSSLRLAGLLIFLAGLMVAGGSVVLLQRDGPGEPPTSVVTEDTAPAAAPDVAPAAQPQAMVEPPIEPGRPMPDPWAAAPTLKANAAAPPQVGGLAAVVVDEASGAVLYDKQAFLPLPPASLTKIPTLILALERGNLDAEVVSDVDSPTMRGSTVMGLLPGDVFKLRDLLYGMMLPSGNDASLAIGRHLSGSDAAFVANMNLLTKRLGLQGSNFINPHGLGGGLHVSSAYDLAIMSRYGMSLPGFKEIVTARSWKAAGSRTIPLGNINGFLNYAGADGIKTGYTRSAGPTLAASVTRNGRRLYAVVLNSQSREVDASVLLNWAFANHTWP